MYNGVCSKDVMQGKLYQKCAHLLYCSTLSLGGNVNTRRMLAPDIGSIFHIKKSKKYFLRDHRLITIQTNNKYRLFKIWGFLVHNNLVSEAQRSYALASLNYRTKRDHACNYFGLLLQGYTILWSFERQESIRAVFLTTSSQSGIVQ